MPKIKLKPSSKVKLKPLELRKKSVENSEKIKKEIKKRMMLARSKKSKGFNIGEDKKNIAKINTINHEKNKKN